jgi:hypothetical protein
MKKKLTQFTGVFFLFAIILGCKKDEDRFQPELAGQIVFWTSEDFGDITVKCNGREHTITYLYYSGLPDCGDVGCATFNLMPGTYEFSASNGYDNWEGEVTVIENLCSKMRLIE